MKPTEYLFELINKSNISLLGYTTKEERIKDEIISKVSHIELPGINSSFSILSYIRDSKIDTILDNRKITPTHFLLDINSIDHSLKKIAVELIDTNFKLLITCPIYNSMGNNEYNFSGGNTGLYMADFVGIIRDSKIIIMKTRYGGSKIDIKYDSK
jgi:hypothetical protein